MALASRVTFRRPRRIVRYAGSVWAYSWRWQRQRAGAWFVTALVFGVVLAVASVAHMLVWLTEGSLTSQLRSASEMQVFLSDSATAEQQDALKAKLVKVTGVRAVSFRSKAQAASLASHDAQLAPLEAASDGNPFPASFVLQMNDPKVGERVLKIVTGDAAVDSKVPASYTAAQAQQVSRALGAFQIGSWALDLAALGVGVLVALALLRGELRTRREELRILALVGVPRAVIRLPLLIQALSVALAGSLLAVFSLSYVSRNVVPAIDASLPFLHLGSPAAIVSTMTIGVVVASCVTLVPCALLVRLPR
jgi:cell division transport system permease protein